MRAQDFCSLASAQPAGIDWHQVYCTVCRDGGDLLCCDGCTAAAHMPCIGLDAVPEVCMLSNDFETGGGAYVLDITMSAN